MQPILYNLYNSLKSYTNTKQTKGNNNENNEQFAFETESYMVTTHSLHTLYIMYDYN